MNQTNRLKGFTLIELTVVIVIIAILAAVALPRFTNLQRDARIAKLNGVRGSVQAATSLVHATLLARSRLPDSAVCPGTNIAADNVNTLCTEAGVINVANAHPDVTAFGVAGILSVAGLVNTFIPTRAQLQSEGYGYTQTSTVATFQVLGGVNPAQCAFTYTKSVANAPPVISGMETKGC